MIRWPLFALLVVACADFSVWVDGEEGSSSLPPVEDITMSDSLFDERLKEVLKTVDVYPWIEVVPLGFSEEMGGGKQFTWPVASVRRSYSLLIKEVTLLSVAKTSMGALEDGAVDISWELAKEKKQSLSVASRSLLGDFDSGWHGLGEGLYLPKLQSLDFTLTTRHDNLGQVLPWIVLRGYRLYPKGTISPVQLSEMEHRAAGMALSPFAYVTKMSLSESQKKNTSVLSFNDDFLAMGMRSSVMGMGGDALPEPGSTNTPPSTLIHLEVEADRTMMSEAAPRLLVAGPSRWTEWRWPQPVTVGVGTEWRLHASWPADIEWPSMTPGAELEVVVWGYKLTRVR